MERTGLAIVDRHKGSWTFVVLAVIGFWIPPVARIGAAPDAPPEAINADAIQAGNGGHAQDRVRSLRSGNYGGVT